MNEGRSLPDRDASTATGTEAEGTISTGTARWFVAAATAIAIAVAIHQLFNLRVGGYTMLEGMYLYVLAGIFLAIAFLSFRIRAGASPHVPWYDWALAGASLAVAGYFAATSSVSLDYGWEYAPPQTAVWVSIAFYLLILEATRRAGGLTLFLIVLAFSLYPTFAEKVPDPLSGFTQPFSDVIPFFMISAEASFGIPMQAFGNLVIGFILFGAVLQHTGGGRADDGAASEMVDQGDEARRGEHAAAGPGRFPAAGGRADQFQVERLGGHGGGQHAQRFAEAAIEREFANGRMAFEHVGRDDAHDGQNG